MKQSSTSKTHLSLPLSISKTLAQMGIPFENKINWDVIQAKAKQENKYIFMDCFATWCGPCKTMDRNIYIDDSIGHSFNTNFVFVKVQLDTTTSDICY